MALQPERPADLRLEHVSKSFGAVAAVSDISIDVAHGEFYSLLGPSGCGKTTTLRLVAGFERPDSGRILLAGTDVGAIPPNRRRVNTVFQHYALFPHLTVEDNVAYGLKQRKTPKDELRRRLEEALATVRLGKLRHRRPRELSGGQQQRVALARALINEPTVLLLDEPLAALDLKLRRALQQELKKLQERVGISFVYVTHDQEEALTLSDRIAVMNEGQILQEGSPEEIYERPRSRFVADFIGDTNFFEGVVEDAGAEVVVRGTHGELLRCGAVTRVEVGQSVVVAVRPEKIALANGETWANTADGTLLRKTYLGDIVQLHVLLRGGAHLTVQRQNAADLGEIGVGDSLTLGWAAGSALVMEDRDGLVVRDEDLHLLADSDHPA